MMKFGTDNRPKLMVPVILSKAVSAFHAVAMPRGTATSRARNMA